jgi:hypothetical protein
VPLDNKFQENLFNLFEGMSKININKDSIISKPKDYDVNSLKANESQKEK